MSSRSTGRPSPSAHRRATSPTSSGPASPRDTRRAVEQQLVGTYHAELLARGVTDYDLDQCFDDYRLGQLQGPLITMLGAIFATAERTEAADRMFLAMASRSCAAIRDLSSLDLL